MKAAKFLICIISALLILFAPPTVPAAGNVAAAAANRYARADARDIYFCGKKDLNSALFTIPYTYCVEILSTDGEWYYVKYAEDNSLYRALYGYCLKDNLTPVETPPENIYLNMPVTVTFKTDSPAGSLPVLNELNVTAAFYGTYYAGASAYSYVMYDGTFGYIQGANDNYPLNELPSPPPDTEAPPEGEKTNTALIAALAVVALATAALLLVYITGRKKYYHPDR